MKEGIFLLGIILIIIGILVVMLASFTTTDTKVKGGFVGMIGPFPIGFASDKRTFYILMGIAIIIYILMWFLRK